MCVGRVVENEVLEVVSTLRASGKGCFFQSEQSEKLVEGFP